MKKTEITIDTKKYFINELTLGQMNQVLKLGKRFLEENETALSFLKIDKNKNEGKTNIDIQSLLFALCSSGDYIIELIAIILTPENISLKDKDIEVLKNEISYSMTDNDIKKATSLFFDLTKTSFLVSKLKSLIPTDTIKKFMEIINKTPLAEKKDV